MFQIGKTIKQHLLADTNLADKIGTKIYNLVVVTSENSTTKAPYLVVEINSINPVYTKDLFICNEITFTVIVLAAKYDEAISLSELVKQSLEFKDIEDSALEIDSIKWDNYIEDFDSDFELYNNKIVFSCKAIKK